MSFVSMAENKGQQAGYVPNVPEIECCAKGFALSIGTKKETLEFSSVGMEGGRGSCTFCITSDFTFDVLFMKKYNVK